MMKKPLLIIGILGALISTTQSLSYEEMLEELSDSDGFSHKGYNNLSLQNIPVDAPRDSEALFMAHNDLTAITDQFWTSDCGSISDSSCSRFQHMRFIDLSDNQIQDISSHSFSGMQWLAFIFLANNRLQSVPSNTFTNNKFLMLISVSGNFITHIEPATFQNFTYLKMLFLERNMITAIHCDTFVGLKNLKKLYFSENRVKELSLNTFRDTTNLEILKINNNYLTHLPELLLMNLKNLGILDASHNNIRYIGAKFFFFADYNIKINFRYNFVRKLSLIAFQQVARLKHVDLSFNHLEYVYIGRISFPQSNVNSSGNIVYSNTRICTDTIQDVPCFIFSHFGAVQIFHNIDFSYNNIKELFFIKNEISHTMEFVNISFAGSPRLMLPVAFVKHQQYITHLNMEISSLNWMNITLLNEILQLPYLKSFNIIGSPACDHFMRQMLFSVFNPDRRIRIECGEERRSGKNLPHNSAIDVAGNYFGEESETIAYDQHSCSDLSTENKTTDDLNALDFYPCHIFDTDFITEETIFGGNIDFICKYTIDCSYVSSSILPTIKHPAATCFFLSHSNLDDIRVNNFLELRSVEYLDLSFNMLSHLPDGTFRSLYQLKFLKLNNNKLVHLTYYSFAGLVNLMVLTLHGNKISSYDSHTLAPLWQIKWLSIDFSNLTRLHEETFAKLYYLRKLCINETMDLASTRQILNYKLFTNLMRLETFFAVGFKVFTNNTNSLFNTNTLRILEIVDGAFPVLYREVFSGTRNIENLILSRNNIVHLNKDVFNSLRNLSFLDLSENNITSLHEHLFMNTSHLETLIMSYNRISIISFNLFDYATSLLYLDLSFNLLTEIDWSGSTGSLRLQLLSLDGNMIGTNNNTSSGHFYCSNDSHTNPSHNTSLHLKILDFLKENESSAKKCSKNANILKLFMPGKSNLKQFTIKKNYLRHVTNYVFTNSPELTILVLSFNKINSIGEEAFSSNRNLTTLDLSYNSLSIIQSKLFQSLSELLWLDLRNNKLEFIEEGAFQNLAALKALHVENNNIKYFDFNIFANNNAISTIHLNDNHIQWLNLTNYLFSLETLVLKNNPLASDLVNVFHYMPFLKILHISNTSICEFSNHLMLNFVYLEQFIYGVECLRGLSPFYFTSLQSLSLLNMSLQVTDTNAVESHLSWKNLTLINLWFELPQLVYLVLTGNPICEEVQRTQILENIFLSDSEKNIICSTESIVPNVILSPDANEIPGLLRLKDL